MAYTDEQIAAFPAWLQTILKATPESRAAAGITDEYLDSAVKAYHLDKDYTQKSQRLAEYEKYKDVPLDKASELYAWWQKNGSEATRRWELAERAAAQPEPEARPAGKKKWRDAEAADLYETASLRALFEDLHTDAGNSAYQRWQDEYKKTEVPRLDQVANGMASTVIDLLDFAVEDAIAATKDPKHQRLSPHEVLKQGAARGERDFRKVASAMRQERLDAAKPLEEDAFQRGLEEGRKAADGPSGPLGGARPGWRPDTTEPAPKSRDALFQRVVSAVEQKSGRPVPL